MRIRLSLGTAIVLDLKEGSLPAPPSTAYLLVGDHCLNNCAFCTQARDARSSGDFLSRVSWPSYYIHEVLEALKRKQAEFGRICIQCLNDPEILSKLTDLVKMMIEVVDLPVSVSVGPMDRKRMIALKYAGVERIGIALDAGSVEVFENVKGSSVGNPYTYKGIWEALETAVEVFGKGKVSTHLIVGLGETDSDVCETILKAGTLGVTTSLFAFTPMKGISFKGCSPPLGRYRALQLLRFLITETGEAEGFQFDENGKITAIDEHHLLSMSGIKDSFKTRGCPDCNRPYYNERPRGPIYNHPGDIDEREIQQGINLSLDYAGSHS
jgi:biotin synthase